MGWWTLFRHPQSRNVCVKELLYLPSRDSTYTLHCKTKNSSHLLFHQRLIEPASPWTEKKDNEEIWKIEGTINHYGRNAPSLCRDRNSAVKAEASKCHSMEHVLVFCFGWFERNRGDILKKSSREPKRGKDDGKHTSTRCVRLFYAHTIWSDRKDAYKNKKERLVRKVKSRKCPYIKKPKERKIVFLKPCNSLFEKFYAMPSEDTQTCRNAKMLT